MKNLIATVLIIAAVGLFYLYVSPTYDEIRVMQTEKAQYDEALNNSQKVQDARDEFMGKYNNFPQSDLKRLEKLLPSSVDNIRLIIEVDSVASRQNMILKNVQVATPATTLSGVTGIENQALPTDTTPYGTAELSFDVSGTYEAYRSFIKDIEKSLRIIDITQVSFSSAEEKGVSNRYTFKTTLRTYWLKQK